MKAQGKAPYVPNSLFIESLIALIQMINKDVHPCKSL